MDIAVGVTVKKYSYLAEVEAEKQGVTKNVSAGGVALCMPAENITLGDVLEVSLDLPIGKTIKTYGKIAWVKPIPGTQDCEFGLEFIDIDYRDRIAIDQYIEDEKHKP